MRERVAQGFTVGALVGAVAGAVEALLVPLELALRIPYTIAANGLLGAAVGVAAAALVSLLPGDRRGGGAVAGLTAFAPIAVGLLLFANRVLLRDYHHLYRISLAADAVALVVAAVLAGLLAWGFRRLERSGRLSFTRRGAVALALGLLFASIVASPRVLASRGPAGDTERGDAGPAHPPVVVVSIDTLRPDRLGAGGCPLGTSPELDRLCRESKFFAEALTVSPGSGASHAALMTSRYPISNGVHTNFSIYHDSLVTMTELLRERGYRTGGFVTNVYLSSRFHFPQGFQTFVQTGVVERLAETSPSVLARSLAVRSIVDHVRARFDVTFDPSFETALAWVRGSRRPTFWFVHLMDVHAPYVPPPPYGALFGATRAGDAAWEGRANPYGWRRSEEAYLAEIRFADSKMGRLRRVLERQDLLDDAVLVLSSDHGENLADHEPTFGHGNTLFDATMRILLAIRAPGLTPSLEWRPVENVDVLPTIAPLVGLPVRSEWEGRDALDPDLPPREVTIAQLQPDFAVRTRDSKVILHASGERELFSLRDDPGEQRPRALTEEELARAETRFADWYARYVTDLYERAGGEVTVESLTPETVEKLRALGYLD